MKRLLFLLASAFVLVSCNSTTQDSTKTNVTKVISTNIENADSLANVLPQVWKNTNTVVEGIAHSGKFASKIDSVNAFSFLFEQQIRNFEGLPKEVIFTVYGYALKPNTKTLMVISATDNKVYHAAAFDTLFTTLNEWKEMKATFPISQDLNDDDFIKAYIYNGLQGEMLIDDYKLEFVY